mmetsp:Transcript_33847/g.82045  ORF Transcript_33847/g.82045 Transcript_33847/m.82045 type:complete len:109 (-) Transcript_33847:418-744(-)
MDGLMPQWISLRCRKASRRFRQLVINCVMATDLGDKEMKELRNGRWNTSSSFDLSTADSERSQEKKKRAELRGVSSSWSCRQESSSFWYQGEIGFFRFLQHPIIEEVT